MLSLDWNAPTMMTSFLAGCVPLQKLIFMVRYCRK